MMDPVTPPEPRPLTEAIHALFEATLDVGCVHFDKGYGPYATCEDPDVGVPIKDIPGLLATLDEARALPSTPLCGCDGEHCGDGPMCQYLPSTPTDHPTRFIDCEVHTSLQAHMASAPTDREAALREAAQTLVDDWVGDDDAESEPFCWTCGIRRDLPHDDRCSFVALRAALAASEATE